MIELPRPARLQGAAFYVKILIIIFSPYRDIPRRIGGSKYENGRSYNR